MIISAKDIAKLMKLHNLGKFGLRNAVAIYLAGVNGLTASEISLITIGDLIDKKGLVKKRWVLPSERAFNGMSRMVCILNEHLINDYLDWLIKNKINRTNLNEYRGLDPEARLLVNSLNAAGTVAWEGSCLPQNRIDILINHRNNNIGKEL